MDWWSGLMHLNFKLTLGIEVININMSLNTWYFWIFKIIIYIYFNYHSAKVWVFGTLSPTTIQMNYFFL